MLDRVAALRVSVTTKAYSRLIDTFCREYKTAFVLPSERESRAGFRLCLSLNGAKGAALHARYGPSLEHIAVLRDAAGAVAAGMNFICFPMPERGNVMTVHTTYVFVAAAWRGRGLLRDVYRTIEAAARDYANACGLGDDAAIIFVGEQKDPFRLTVADFRAAADGDGQDAFDRLGMWGQLGARALVFPYVQPSLAPGGPPDSTLFLRVLFREEISAGAADPVQRAVDPGVLNQHLRRFFAISVAKGLYDPDCLPEVQDQMADLQKRVGLGQTVPTLGLPPAATLARWKRAALDRIGAGNDPDDATIGSLLGIASVADAIRRHSLTT